MNRSWTRRVTGFGSPYFCL